MAEHREEPVLGPVGRLGLRAGDLFGGKQRVPLRFVPALLGNIPEDKDDSDDFALLVLDRRRAVGDRPLGPVAGDQGGVVCQADHDSLADHPGDWVLDRPAVVFRDDGEDVLQGLARGLLLSPPGQGPGDRVGEGDPPLPVGRDDGIADAREHGGEPPLVRLGPSPRGVEQLDESGDDHSARDEQGNLENLPGREMAPVIDEDDQIDGQAQGGGECPRPETAEPRTDQHGKKRDAHPTPADRRDEQQGSRRPDDGGHGDPVTQKPVLRSRHHGVSMGARGARSRPAAPRTTGGRKAASQGGYPRRAPVHQRLSRPPLRAQKS